LSDANVKNEIQNEVLEQCCNFFKVENLE